ncbi:MAG: glycosyltransferase [Muribaculum sp.]|nr:glycosyltransferase [Muribaculaceae bacterium]MCM1081306.1 glycosyltransferase [Muribaculum sp.]
MKKVYFLLPNLDAGGAERVTITIARLLHKEGFDVEFINFGVHNGEMLQWIEPEFKLISFGCQRTLQALPRLHRFMRQHQDAIFFSSREHVNLISLIAAKGTEAQCVVRIPNMPKNVLTGGVSGFKMRVIKFINQWALKSAKVIIAQNKEMKKQLETFYNLSADKIVAINNPVDKDNVLKSAERSVSPFKVDEINFVNVCNIAYSKGIDVLEEAWPIVKKSIPNAHMYIIGRTTSDIAKALVRKSAELLDFTFLGFQSNPYPFLKHCNVFVLPSRMEGFPNVVLEAMCFNRPVASTTCVEVIKDIIKPGETGYYCDIEDPQALAECMIKSSQLQNIKSEYSLFDKNILIDCFK